MFVIFSCGSVRNFGVNNDSLLDTLAIFKHKLFGNLWGLSSMIVLLTGNSNCHQSSSPGQMVNDFAKV